MYFQRPYCTHCRLRVAMRKIKVYNQTNVLKASEACLESKNLSDCLEDHGVKLGPRDFDEYVYKLD